MGWVLIAVAGCAAEPTQPPEMDAIRRKAPEALWRALAESEPQPFIVAVATAPETASEQLDRGSWMTNKDILLRALDDAASDDLVIEQTWSELPLVQVRAASTSAAIAALESDEALVAFPVERYELTDAESFPLINQPAAVASGALGAGTAVAVLDTGANYAHADLGSCTSPGVPSTTCRVAYAADFAPNDSALDANGHGTNVSAIIAGVAPGTKILALDVFNGSGASSTDIINAINWVIANRATYNIASMNLSLGGGASTTPCSSDSMGIAIASARTAGVAAAVASGNNGYTNQISSPGCAPASISVGAVWDSDVGGRSFSACSDPTTAADKITCFSNSASFLTLLAPGAMITAGGYTMAGTSQATPHVAGALAALHGAYPSENVDQLVARLTSTGKSITDPRNNVTKPRIDLYAAVGSPPVDVEAPTGTVTINGGAAYAKTTAVTLAITASDASAPVTMCVANTTTCTTFVTLATSKTWTLAAGDGAKTVTVFLRDARTNTTTASTSPQATITLDATVPTNGTLTATPSAGQVALSWTGFADATSGIEAYRVMVAAGATAPTTCATGTPVYSGAGTSFTATGLTNGTTYSYRVCAVDRAGNVSTGVTATARPAPEYEPPTGAVTINGGAELTKTTAVTLAIAATDPSGVSTMCVSNTTTCTAFVAFATTKTWTLTAGDGVKTVYVFFRDAYNNTTVTAATDTIRLDATAPTNGTVTATASDGQVALAWTGFGDATSGIAGYRVMIAASATAPATCTTGTPLYEGTATSTTATGLVNGTTYSFRVCAVDVAGNVSAGVTATVRPAPEYIAPSGAVTINAGAELTNTTAVTLTIAGSDASGVSSMCVSNSTTCTAFVAFATTKAWTLTAGDGVKTVYVFLRDAYNNTSVTAVTDTIRLDATVPVNGTVTATPGNGQVSLAWTGFSDAGTGIVRYRVVGAATTAPTTCTGTTLFEGLATSFVVTGLSNGTTYGFRVCAVDAAGNISAGSVASAAPRPEFTAPTGTVVLNGGADLTKSRTVTLTLSATDDTGVGTMCISEGTTCTTFVAYATSATFTVAADGVRTVKVWFRDIWGNVASPVSDTINVDTVAPTGGTLAGTAGTNQSSLSWTAATDANSGLASYKLVGVVGTVVPAAACTTGTVLYEGTATSYVHTFATKTTWSYRLCASDRAGNVSAGTTKTLTSL